MLPNRFRISKRSTDVLKMIKGRTGVTPNILCRMALALSLRQGASAGDKDVDLEGSEFNMSTLFGDHHLVYEVLVQQVHGALSPKEVQRVVAAHIDSGVDQLRRVRSLGDLLTLGAANSRAGDENAESQEQAI
jgi:DNA sulfur modification protein DndE